MFKPLPPGLAQRLIRDEVDELTPLAEARNSQLKAIPCKRCGGNMHPEMLPHMFSPNDPLPRTCAKCVDCGYTVDPLTGIVLAMGNPGKVEDPFKINTD